MEGTTFCTMQNETLSEVHFEDCWLVCKDVAQLLAESTGTDPGQAKNYASLSIS